MPEMKWVFDTVSLSNFLLSDTISLLKKRYKKHGFITGEVYDELSAGMSEYPKLRQIDKLLDPKIFKRVLLSGAEHKHFLQMIGHLGKGEASCIAYAKEQAASNRNRYV
jgi:predicted nucleic acid-binding protein